MKLLVPVFAGFLMLGACGVQPGDGPSADAVRELGAVCATYASALNTAATLNLNGSLSETQVAIVDQVVETAGPVCENPAVPTRATEVDAALSVVKMGIERLLTVTGV